MTCPKWLIDLYFNAQPKPLKLETYNFGSMFLL